jgi:hypothetical protein
MDPKACLDAAESAVMAAEATEDNLLHIEECEEHLANYREWRRKDGFEPEGGDARCRSITIRLEALPTESGRPFSYSGLTSGPTTRPPSRSRRGHQTSRPPSRVGREAARCHLRLHRAEPYLDRCQ